MERGQLILHNGEYYKFPVQKIETADALQMTSDEIDYLQLITTSTHPAKLEDSAIFATGVKFYTLEGLIPIQKRYMLIPIT